MPWLSITTPAPGESEKLDRMEHEYIEAHMFGMVFLVLTTCPQDPWKPKVDHSDTFFQVDKGLV
jgi:hypothetical protein